MESRQRNKKVNISVIAELAGTSVMTVSRVLNNKPDVAEATRDRILRVMKEQQFKPHAVARKLSGAASQIIGVALYTEGHPMFGLYVSVLKGLQVELAAFDYDLLILGPSSKDEYGDKIIRTSLLDGLVLMGPAISESDVLKLRDEAIPFLTIGHRSYDGYTAPFVAPNYQKAFKEAVEFAWMNGVRDIRIIISGHDRQPSNVDRIAGLRSAMTSCGLDHSQVRVIYVSGEFEDGYQASLELNHAPEAVLLDSSDYSFGFVLGLRERGWKVPDDTLLIGIDYEDHVIRRCEDILGVKLPQWTISWLEVGKSATNHILGLISGKSDGKVQEYVDFTRLY